MFASISGRIAGLGLIVLVALVSLAGLLMDASHQTTESFRWVTHSAAVIETTQEALDHLREAESGQRGFIITHEPAYARSFGASVGESAAAIKRIVALTRDNPPQHARARELAGLMARRATTLRGPLDLGRRGDFASAVRAIQSGTGRDLMDAVNVRAEAFLDEERRFQKERVGAAEQRVARGERLALFGATIVALIVLVGFAFLVRSIRRPLKTILEAMTGLGHGVRGARVGPGMGSIEFRRLARGYNDMADRLERALDEQEQSEQRLQSANAELLQNTATLQKRGEAIEILGGMAHRMQAARTDEELASIIQVFVPRIMPDLPGTLYAHNNSRNLLLPLASWGDDATLPGGFAPDQCWALRRGQSHFVSAPGCDIVCGHAHEGEVYHCEPLLAGGEVIGVLTLRGSVEGESRYHLTVLTENIASALVNHRLQRSLREQTIRDPLTGLFNRRYMEEALALEIARASRSGTPLSLVMCDVDHFKRFNDEFGHDAGDAVLQTVAAEMRSRFRDGDVVCRYGGEEFTIIAPGTNAETLLHRVEIVRQAITELNIRQNGQTLGSTSMSFGVATWDESMARDGSTLVRAADAALYEAKRSGRNRTVVSRLAA
ncbi:diguanylate cyclase [Sphingomonas jatrophae]|uniref:diguanylate cyclase n=1 Tax=Sphingomonas jatrophae TaxID=1166337 RepID=A0A1I6JXD0_9SPHN|nr:diguanylate cyclase [Sphingomonas jatrophae]SFR83558.1 diguanylate cyclase (GGDEF) domain-containing protein [Sphingomonas jatrophae]